MKKQVLWMAFAITVLFVQFFISCKPEVKIVEKEKTVEVDKKADETAPGNVTNLAATAKDSRVLLTWTEAADEDVYGYEVSYSGENPINRVILPAVDSKSLIAAKGSGGCYVSGLTNGTEYTFTVKTLDTSGNKSAGVSVKSTPVSIDASETMQISLTAAVPHENGYTGNKSNTKVTVTANITTASTVKKVVWKKNGSLIAKTLLADTDATNATKDGTNDAKWTFDIEATDETANGTYTVAAIDETGREEIEQIKIDQFDFTPPSTVMSLTALYSVVDEKDIVIVSWIKPATDDFDHIEIKYIYYDGTNNSGESAPVNVTSANKSFTVKTGVESSAKTYKYFVKSVDKLGNKSSAMPVSVAVVDGVVVGYQFHEIPEYLPADTDGTLGTSGTYVYFGDWPQTIKNENIIIYENDSMEMGDFTYYRGSDENWYVKCIENAYENDYIYSDGTNVARKSANSTKYFKVEPIKWRILNPDATGNEKKILLAETILTAHIVAYYHNNYKDSEIRTYLITTFLNEAFTSSAQSQIVETTIDNTARSTNPDGNATLWDNGYNLYACDNTTDKIFLLSEQEVTKADYGFAAYDSQEIGNARIRMPTDYAKANNTKYVTGEGCGGYWCLRSPYYNDYYYMRNIFVNGFADDSYYASNACGVVPALCLN